MISTTEIIHLCRQVSYFSRQADWHWKGLPVVQWEFPTMGDFANAKMQLLQAIEPMMMYTKGPAEWQRIASPDTFEIDCHGVTFRLICRQQLASGTGQTYGAAQVVIRSLPSFKAPDDKT